MYKKLMFLISFVALLVWISSASAQDIEVADKMWDGGGLTDSVCDPLNWDPDGVPDGTLDDQEPAMRYRDDGKNYAEFDCDWNMDGYTIKMPAWAGPPGEANMTTLHILADANVICQRFGPGWGEEDEGYQHGLINMYGGLLTCTKVDDEALRVCDNRDATLTFNIFGGTIRAPYQGVLRAGDEGGFLTINQTGGLIDMDGQIRICKCFLEWNISGGTINTNDNFRLDGEKEDEGRDQTLNVSGTAEVLVGGDLSIGHEVDDDATCTVNVEGGTVNAEKILFHDDGGGGHAELNVSGGLVVASEELKIKDDGTSTVNVTGGLLQACHIVLDAGIINLIGGTLEVTCDGSIGCDGGVINITTGTLVLPGDQCASLPPCITGYYVDLGGGCAGSRGVLVCEYDPGTDKTTVTAIMGDLNKAWSPSPKDGEDEQVVGVVLSWCAGACLGTKGHLVFFGDTYEAVDTATVMDPEFRCIKPPGSMTFDPGKDPTIGDPIVLGLWETYFWRIDELHYGGPCPTVPDAKGDVWSFTTGCELIDGDLNLDCLVNFEDYAMMADDWRVEVWFPDDVTP